MYLFSKFIFFGNRNLKNAYINERINRRKV